MIETLFFLLYFLIYFAFISSETLKSIFFSVQILLVHPVINVRNQLVGSPFDKDVTIECNVEASPKSINYWIKDTGKLLYSA